MKIKCRNSKALQIAIKTHDPFYYPNMHNFYPFDSVKYLYYTSNLIGANLHLSAFFDFE